jgi:hypothetical protein
MSFEKAFDRAWTALQQIASGDIPERETPAEFATRARIQIRALYPAETHSHDDTRRVIARCSWCGEPMPTPDRPQGGGRTKLYCSETHRVAAHRARKLPSEKSRGGSPPMPGEWRR